MTESGIGDEGEGFHGIIAFDCDGDHMPDASTWVGVGPEGEAVAEPALLNGPACREVTEIGVYLTECVGT